jgi:hypothetical protein
MFHPRGIVCLAEVRPVTQSLPERGLAGRLSGHALVRFSGALWKAREWPDVLGCALRFRRDARVTPEPGPDDQDLLLATIRNPWTTMLAPLTTHQHDYLANDYFGVSPFAVPAGGDIKFRLRCSSASAPGRSRGEKLERALCDAEPVRLTLDVRPNRFRAEYAPCVELTLLERVSIDEDALRFDPFRTGRGVRPKGLVHHARIAPYAASQRFRPHGHAGARGPAGTLRTAAY